MRKASAPAALQDIQPNSWSGSYLNRQNIQRTDQQQMQQQPRDVLPLI